jgi:hypothetical protein
LLHDAGYLESLVAQTNPVPTIAIANCLILYFLACLPEVFLQSNTPSLSWRRLDWSIDDKPAGPMKRDLKEKRRIDNE